MSRDNLTPGAALRSVDQEWFAPAEAIARSSLLMDELAALISQDEAD